MAFKRIHRPQYQIDLEKMKGGVDQWRETESIEAIFLINNLLPGGRAVNLYDWIQCFLFFNHIYIACMLYSHSIDVSIRIFHQHPFC